jgi:hypothetical protein
MKLLRVLVALVVAAMVVGSGLGGVAASDSSPQTGVTVDAFADVPDSGIAFSGVQSASAGFSGATPVIEISGSGSVAGGSAVAVGYSSAI